MQGGRQQRGWWNNQCQPATGPWNIYNKNQLNEILKTFWDPSLKFLQQKPTLFIQFLSIPMNYYLSIIIRINSYELLLVYFNSCELLPVYNNSYELLPVYNDSYELLLVYNDYFKCLPVYNNSYDSTS